LSKRPAPGAVELIGLGSMVAGCVVVGVGVGYWIGSATGAGLVADLTGLAVGVVAAVATAYFKIKRYL
jgi:hypothetical protein